MPIPGWGGLARTSMGFKSLPSNDVKNREVSPGSSLLRELADHGQMQACAVCLKAHPVTLIGNIPTKEEAAPILARFRSRAF